MSLCPTEAAILLPLRTASGRRDSLFVFTGRVTNVNGEPLRGVKLEIWQANAVGRYAHASETNEAPLDPNFEGLAS